MNKEKILELKKVLESKIDQLLVLIGDSSKLLHFDIFKINNSNLDDNLIKIRKIFEKNPWEELEVLVMKKDMIKLTEDFLKRDILEELEKENKKLKKIRYIYLTILITFTLVWVLFYSWLLKSILGSVLSTKQIVYRKEIVFSGCKSSNNIKSNKNVAENLIILSWDDLTWLVNSGSLKSWNKLLSVNSGTVITWNIVTWLNIKKVTKRKEYSVISWNFVLFKTFTWALISWNLFSGVLEKQNEFLNQKIKLIGYKSGIDSKNIENLILLFSWDLNLTWTKYNVLAYLSGTITWNIIIWKLRKISLYKEKVEPIFDVDINYHILKWKQLEEYKKEKKQACPYTWYIYVSVRALNLRQKATKYSRRITLLRRWAKLKVLWCQKNLKSNSWWYKVYIPKLDLEWWVSTIWVSK